MPLVTADSIVLQTFPYSETSKVLRLLTRSHGVVPVIAKGALRPRSRYGGVLESFTEGAATYYAKDGRELQTLSGFELVRSHQGLARDLVRFGGASLLAELVLRTASEAGDPALYDGLRTALQRLESADQEDVEVTAIASVWTIVRLLGFAPNLDTCLDCDRPVPSGEDASFDYEAGGIRCSRCGPALVGRRIPPEALVAFRQLAGGDVPSLAVTAGHWRLLARYLAYHVAEGATLHSLAFLADTLEGR